MHASYYVEWKTRLDLSWGEYSVTPSPPCVRPRYQFHAYATEQRYENFPVIAVACKKQVSNCSKKTPQRGDYANTTVKH